MTDGHLRTFHSSCSLSLSALQFKKKTAHHLVSNKPHEYHVQLYHHARHSAATSRRFVCTSAWSKHSCGLGLCATQRWTQPVAVWDGSCTHSPNELCLAHRLSATRATTRLVALRANAYLRSKKLPFQCHLTDQTSFDTLHRATDDSPSSAPFPRSTELKRTHAWRPGSNLARIHWRQLHSSWLNN